MPAMGAANWIGLHGKRQVLMDAGVLPPDSFGIGIFARKRLDAVDLSHHPLAGLKLAEVDERRGPSLAAQFFAQTPSSEVMRAGGDAGADALGDPYLVDEVANLGVDLEQVAGGDAEARRILGVDPEGIAMGDFIKPLRVAGARMDQGGQSEGRQQEHLAA